MIRSLLKRIIPLKWLRAAKHSFIQIDNLLAFGLSKTSLGTQLYYFLFDRSFVREQVTTLRGRAAYKKQQGVSNARHIRLRRNIHRLEKGLIMRPRREVFGLDYIDETVADYERYLIDDTKNAVDDELNWFADVLGEYFNVVDKTHATVASAEKRFANCHRGASQTIHEFSSSSTAKLVPYSKESLTPSNLQFEELLALSKQRRSVRWFQARTVPQELILKAIEVARFAPSACNRQPFRFVVASEPDKASELLKFAMGTVGFSQQVPCAIAVVGDLSSYEAERDRHLIYIDASLAAMQLMLALETLGLSSCPINWPDIEVREKQMASFLDLSDTQRPVMLMAIGFAEPDGKIPYSQKCSAEQLSTFL